jgi:hypothetical protein
MRVLTESEQRSIINTISRGSISEFNDYSLTFEYESNEALVNDALELGKRFKTKIDSQNKMLTVTS